MKQVEIYTDGACIGNPGAGGYGVVLRCGDHYKELAGGFRLTTNNRMELMAAIVGLRALKHPCLVKLYSDSQYLVQGMNLGWAKKWRVQNWMRNKKERASNSDLWAELLDLCDRYPVEFIWIKGHGGHPDNERCDFLAVQAAKGDDLPIDAGYENNSLLSYD